MRYLIVALLATVCVAGCAATAATPIRSPNGENWIGIDCRSQSQVACLAEAGNQCPGGYDQIDSESHFSMVSSAVATQQVAVATSHESHHGSMVIKCHGQSKVELEYAREFSREEAERAIHYGITEQPHYNLGR